MCYLMVGLWRVAIGDLVILILFRNVRIWFSKNWHATVHLLLVCETEVFTSNERFLITVFSTCIH